MATVKKEKNFAWKKMAVFYFVTGTIVLAGLFLYPLFKNSKENVWISRLKWFPVQNAKSVKFDPFIIPFKEHGKFTYISLSFSFDLSNKELMDEMREKNNWIRGIIYNILNENISVLENISSLMALKKTIINGVNNALTAGRVEKVIIIDFSPV